MSSWAFKTGKQGTICKLKIQTRCLKNKYRQCQWQWYLLHAMTFLMFLSLLNFSSKYGLQGIECKGTVCLPPHRISEETTDISISWAASRLWYWRGWRNKHLQKVLVFLIKYCQRGLCWERHLYLQVYLWMDGVDPAQVTALVLHRFHH